MKHEDFINKKFFELDVHIRQLCKDVITDLYEELGRDEWMAEQGEQITSHHPEFWNDKADSNMEENDPELSAEDRNSELGEDDE